MLNMLYSHEMKFRETDPEFSERSTYLRWLRTNTLLQRKRWHRFMYPFYTHLWFTNFFFLFFRRNFAERILT